MARGARELGQNSLIRKCLSLKLPHDVQFLFPCREGEA
jgi:hypothetical protein